MPLLVVFEKTECRHRPEHDESGGFPPTPPRLFFFFRLRRAVMAIVDEDDEDDDDDDEDQACGQIHSDFGAERRRRFWVDEAFRVSGER